MSTTSNLGCLGYLLQLFGLRDTSGDAREIGADSDSSGEMTFPYRLRDAFLSPAELSFYRVLTLALEGRALICPKVRLQDIFFVTRPHENRSSQARIAQKHLDFLLCDPHTLRPQLGIELDDSSHARPDRQARDAFVDQVFAAASLPLLHIPVHQGYAPAVLRRQLEPHLNSTAPSLPTNPVASNPLPGMVPVCIKCGVPMVARVASRGEHSGQSFYGCPHYPRCRETVPLAA